MLLWHIVAMGERKGTYFSWTLFRLQSFYRARDCWADPKRTYALPPSKNGLFKVIDSFANSSVEGYPPKLEQDGTRGRVDEVTR
jgi:hypothetical protein